MKQVDSGQWAVDKHQDESICPPSAVHRPLTWGITTGQAGMEAQVKALALALGIEPVMKRVQVREPYAHFPSILFASPLRRLIPMMLGKGAESIAPPYPDLIISCGRRGALVALGIKAKNPATKCLHIQDPQMPPRYFDLVVAMGHDKVSGPNVIKTHYALHSITPQRLEVAAQHFAPVFAAYPKPQVAVLIGGSTNKYRVAKSAMLQVIESLSQLLEQMEGSLLITPSRRTGEHNIKLLREAFAGNPRVYIYDFDSENPYMGMLALADAIVATNDSVNMMSEAHATGKPLYILPFEGHLDSKPARFAQMLLREGGARQFSGRLEAWQHDRPDEMERIAIEVESRLRLG